MPPTTPRKRGAPFGNRNALKHGYYSHIFRPGETRPKEDCPPPDSMSDEIALIRVLIRRAVEEITGSETMPEKLEVIRTIAMAANAIARLQRTQLTVTGGRQGEIQRALEEALAEFAAGYNSVPDLPPDILPN